MTDSLKVGNILAMNRRNPIDFSDLPLEREFRVNPPRRPRSQTSLVVFALAAEHALRNHPTSDR